MIAVLLLLSSPLAGLAVPRTASVVEDAYAQPRRTVETYYQALRSGDLKLAYEQLSILDRSYINCDDWVRLNHLDSLLQVTIVSFQGLKNVQFQKTRAGLDLRCIVEGLDLKKIETTLAMPETDPGFPAALLDHIRSIQGSVAAVPLKVFYVSQSMIQEEGEWHLFINAELDAARAKADAVSTEDENVYGRQGRLLQKKAAWDYANKLKAGVYGRSLYKDADKQLADLVVQIKVLEQGGPAQVELLKLIEAERLTTDIQEAELQRLNQQVELARLRVELQAKLVEQARLAAMRRDLAQATENFKTKCIQISTWTQDSMKNRLTVTLANPGPVDITGISGQLLIQHKNGIAVRRVTVDLTDTGKVLAAGGTLICSTDYVLTTDDEFVRLAWQLDDYRYVADASVAEPLIYQAWLPAHFADAAPSPDMRPVLGDLTGAFSRYYQGGYKLVQINRIPRGGGEALAIALQNIGGVDVGRIKIQVTLYDARKKGIDQHELDNKPLLKLALGLYDPKLACFEFPMQDLTLPAGLDPADIRMRIQVTDLAFAAEPQKQLVKAYQDGKLSALNGNLDELFGLPSVEEKTKKY